MVFRIALALVAGLVGGPAVAEDVAAAESLYGDVCANCHGPAGKGMASFPSLAGHTEDYLHDKLVAYRAGEQVGPNSALMIPNASDLSDEEIASLAAFMASSFQ